VVTRADLPSLEQKDGDVAVEERVLTSRGKHTGEGRIKAEHDYCCERWRGASNGASPCPPVSMPTG